MGEGLKATFPLATQNSGGDEDKILNQSLTDWHRIVVGSPLLNTCENHLIKNTVVLIEGELKTSGVKQPKVDEGLEHYIVTNEIVAKVIKILPIK